MQLWLGTTFLTSANTTNHFLSIWTEKDITLCKECLRQLQTALAGAAKTMLQRNQESPETV